MWLTLSAQHLEQVSDNLYDLQSRFYDYRYDSIGGIKSHVATIKSIAHHLGEVGKPVEER